MLFFFASLFLAWNASIRPNGNPWCYTIDIARGRYLHVAELINKCGLCVTMHSSFFVWYSIEARPIWEERKEMEFGIDCLPSLFRQSHFRFVDDIICGTKYNLLIRVNETVFVHCINIDASIKTIPIDIALLSLAMAIIVIYTCNIQSITNVCSILLRSKRVCSWFCR